LLNALTVDLEDWYQTQLLKVCPAAWDTMEDRIEIGTRQILQLLEEHQVRATFFVLGYAARRNPGLVKEIAANGHEIGCHGYWHQPVYQQTREQFRADLTAARQEIESLIGRAVTLYRAPSWSISRQTLWALQELSEQGFRCDSSVQPFWTPLSGVIGAPAFPYYPVVSNQLLPLLEFPPTTVGFGPVRLPCTGGTYFRVLPAWASNWGLGQVNRRRPGMVYLHPWELDPEQPRFGNNGAACLHRLSLRTTQQKLSSLLQRFQFATLGEVISGRSFPALSV
jgi:polysaccharide deacetylase family protein (PEP-CTERM system associated)